jgi:hypothetical protein
VCWDRLLGSTGKNGLIGTPYSVGMMLSKYHVSTRKIPPMITIIPMEMPRLKFATIVLAFADVTDYRTIGGASPSHNRTVRAARTTADTRTCCADSYRAM